MSGQLASEARVIVISNCATAAYTNGLKALFPKWEVRGVIYDLADQWLLEGKLGFADYVCSCDIYVGVPPSEYRFRNVLPVGAEQIIIPSFWFHGLQPDCFHLHGFLSPLSGGDLYSRIVVAAFVLGIPENRVPVLFNSATYDAFDFLGEYDREERSFLARFKQHDIDLEGYLDKWASFGNFLYSYNHPRVDVLTDILQLALEHAGLLTQKETRPLDVQDDLKDSIIWPIYPEIAKRHSLSGSLVWRRGRNQGYQTLDLSQFISASYQALRAKPLPQLAELQRWAKILRSVSG